MDALEVTGEFITQAIATQLKGYFPDITRYTETQDEGFKRPCFYVDEILVEHEKLMRERYRRQHHVDIMFFPPLEDDFVERTCRDMANQLSDRMRKLEVPGHEMFAREVSWKRVQNILHYYVTYPYHVLWQKTEHDALMMQLELNIRIKEGS